MYIYSLLNKLSWAYSCTVSQNIWPTDGQNPLLRREQAKINGWICNIHHARVSKAITDEWPLRNSNLLAISNWIYYYIQFWWPIYDISYYVSNDCKHFKMVNIWCGFTFSEARYLGSETEVMSRILNESGKHDFVIKKNLSQLRN